MEHAVVLLLVVLLIAAGVAGAESNTIEQEKLEYSFDIWDWTAPASDLALFDKWAADLKSSGITRVELSTPWNLLEPEPGKIDLTFIRERLAVCKKYGLGMRLRINSYYAGCVPGWYKGDLWQDAKGQTVMGIPSITDERFWEHYAPLCTAIAKELKGEDVLYNAFIGVHAELKYSDWWTYDPSSVKLWQQVIKPPRPKWLSRVVPDDVTLPDNPPTPEMTKGTPDRNPANLAFIAFREWCWRRAVERFTEAVRAGDPKARISSPLGESYRRFSAQFSNLDYWGLTRGSNQVVHSYDFFWHPGNTPVWHVQAVLDTFKGITGLPVCFEFDSLDNIKQFGYSDEINLNIADAVVGSGSGVKLANMSYTPNLPGSHPVIKQIGERMAKAKASQVPKQKDTVLLFFSKWANYCYREETEWLHDAQFGHWKLLKDMGIPVRVICEDNLDEDLSGYKGLLLAFSPLDLIPAEDREAIKNLKLPAAADLLSAPQIPPHRAVIMPLKAADFKPECQNSIMVIGVPLGYYYLHGSNQDECREIMRVILHKAGITGS